VSWNHPLFEFPIVTNLTAEFEIAEADPFLVGNLIENLGRSESRHSQAIRREILRSLARHATIPLWLALLAR
jgi:hypothetical protein